MTMCWSVLQHNHCQMTLSKNENTNFTQLLKTHIITSLHLEYRVIVKSSSLQLRQYSHNTKYIMSQETTQSSTSSAAKVTHVLKVIAEIQEKKDEEMTLELYFI